MSPTLLIVDDHAAFRAYVRTLLDAGAFDVTGEAPDGESAIDAVQDLRPDVVLLDVQMPGIDGFEVARRLAALPDAPTVVLTSTRDPDAYGHLLTETPAHGFIPKQDLSADALTAMIATV